MSHEFIVGVPHCNEPATVFAETLAAIAASSMRPQQLMIIDNGDEALDPGAIEDRVSSVIAVHLTRPGRNVGCAGAWNAIHARAMPGVTTIIVNADCAVMPDTFERMLVAPAPAIVCALGFGCFRLDAAIYERIGPFDEAYYPVYWEDTDYRYRLKLAGIAIDEWPFVEAERLDAKQFGRARYSTGIAHGWRHDDGRGYQGWSGDKLAWFYQCWEKNRDRYAAKWGGTVGEETFTEPFGGQKEARSMGGLLAAMQVQNPELASAMARHYTGPNHYQDHLREILLSERRDGGSPRTIVETGVSYGVSSDRILATLDEIGIPGHGVLYSIDASPPEGIFEISHPRWSKFRQMSTEALPDIYERTGPWDVFLHDSDHEVWCQTFEYELAWHFVRGGGLILSDDIPWGTPPHRAWDRFCLRHGISYTMAGHCAVARTPVAKPGSPTTRVDRDWIDQVVGAATRLAAVAEREYALVKDR